MTKSDDFRVKQKKTLLITCWGYSGWLVDAQLASDDVEGLGPSFNILVSGKPIKYVHPSRAMKILGSMISGSSKDPIDIEKRILNAWKAFYAQKDTFLNHRIDPAIRIGALESLISPVLLYGAGSWSPTLADLDRIHQAHKQMCVRVLALKMRESEAWLEFLSRRSRRVKAIWQALSIKPWDLMALQRAHRWAGTIAHYESRNPDWLPNVTSRWRDSQYLSFKRAQSYDGKRLYRGHRRAPWRWESPFYFYYNSSYPGDYPSWRTFACTHSWSESQDQWVQWRLSRASNLIT